YSPYRIPSSSISESSHPGNHALHSSFPQPSRHLLLFFHRYLPDHPFLLLSYLRSPHLPLPSHPFPSIYRIPLARPSLLMFSSLLMSSLRLMFSGTATLTLFDKDVPSPLPAYPHSQASSSYRIPCVSSFCLVFLVS
ncbi:hypothetical protein PRIPAC_92609, partial [Pristionchus pacificus]|uniref:Uncharacterized protein n=1 Tax=Pristionchus pacificus TaxID=54126 RepID=A0A2A6C919_PRIPA